MSEKHRNSQQSKGSKNSNDPKPGKSKDTSVKREKHHRPEKKVINMIDNLCEVSARLTRILSEANIRLKEKGIIECDTCRTTGEQYKRYLKTIKILEMLVNGVFEKEQINKLDASQKRASKDYDVYILTDIQKQGNMFFRQSRCCDVTNETTVRGVKKNPKFEHNLKCFLVLLQRTVAELILQICFLKSQTELLSKNEQLKKFDVPMMHLKILNFEYTNLTDKIIYLIDFETSSAEYNKKKKFDGYCVLCAKEEITDLLDNLNEVLNCTKRIKLVPKETKDDTNNSKVCCHRCFPHIHGEVNGNPVVLKFNQPKGKIGSGIQTSPEDTKENIENDINIGLVHENNKDNNSDAYEPKKSTDFVKKSESNDRSVSLTDDADKQFEVVQPRSADIGDTKTEPFDDTNEIQDLPYDYNASDFDEQKLSSQPISYIKMKDSDDKFEIQEQYEPPIVKEDRSCNTDETYDQWKNLKNNEKDENQDEENGIKPTKSNENVKGDDDFWDINKTPNNIYIVDQQSDTPLGLKYSEIKHPDENIERKLTELGADTILNTMKPAECSNVNTLLIHTPSNDALPYVISLQSLPLSEKDIEIITQKSKEMSDTEKKVDPINLQNEVIPDSGTSHEHIYNIFDRETGPFIPSFASLILKDDELPKINESQQNNVYKNQQNQFIKQNVEIRYVQLENNQKIFNLKPRSVFRTKQSAIVSPLTNNSDLYVNLSTSKCYSGYLESCTSISESLKSQKNKIESALKTNIIDRNRLDKSIHVVYRRDNSLNDISDKLKQTSSEDLMKQLIFLNNDTIKQLEGQHKVESFDRCYNTQYKNIVKHTTDDQTLKSYFMCLINNLKTINFSNRHDKIISNNAETVADSLKKHESNDCKKNIIQFTNIDSSDIVPCKNKILYTNKANNTNLCLNIKEVKKKESKRQQSLNEEFNNTLINSKLSVLSFEVNEELCNLNDDTTESDLEIYKKLKILKFIRQDILEKMNLNSEAETNLKRKCLDKLLNFMENEKVVRNQQSLVKKRTNLQKCKKSMEVLKKYIFNNTVNVVNNNANKILNTGTGLIKEDKLRIGFKQAMNNCEKIDKIKTSSDKNKRKSCYKIPKLLSRCKRKQSIHSKPLQLNKNINRALTDIEKSLFLSRNNNLTNVRRNSNATFSTRRKLQSKSKRLINRQKCMNKERYYFSNLRKKKSMKPIMPTVTCMKFKVSLKLPKPMFVLMYYEKVNIALCTLVIKFQIIQTKHIYNNYTIEKYEAIFSKMTYYLVNPKIIHYIVKKPHLTVKKCTCEINVVKCTVVKYETVLKVIRLYPSSMSKVMFNWSGDTRHIGRYSFNKTNMLDHCMLLKFSKNKNKKSVLKSCPEVLRNKFYRRYYKPLTMKNGSPLLLFDKFQSPLTDSKGYPIIVNGQNMLRLNKLGQPISDHLGNKIYDRKGNVYSPNGKQMKFHDNYFVGRIEREVNNF